MPVTPPATSDRTARDALYAEARRTPLARAAVRKLATDLRGRGALSALADAARHALDEAGLHVATVLAFALAVEGAPVDAAIVAPLLAEIDADAQVGPLARACGDAAALALARVIDDADATGHRKLLALLVLADVLASREPPAAPPRETLVTSRWLARLALAADEALLLGAAAERLGDPGLLTLAAPYVKLAKKGKREIEEILATSRAAPLDALPETASRELAVGFTVKRAGPAPGRNDACPCGSGKKYKKCCGLEGALPSFEPGRIEEAKLATDQAETLRGSELVRLDVDRVPPEPFLAAADRAVAIREWDLVARFIASAEARKDLGPPIASEIRTLAIEMALTARAAEPFERFAKDLDAAESAAFALDRALLADTSPVLRKLEELATEALRSESAAEGAELALDLAFVLLSHQPALGLFVARGALDERFPKDSRELLQRIEDARDRLLVAPSEPWWDTWEAMLDASDEQRAARSKAAGEKELRAKLRKARDLARKASAEVEKLKTRAREVEDALAAPAPPKKQRAASQAASSGPEPADPAAAAALQDERKRLRTKIDELQRIIGEGQEERRELRQKLADAVDEADRAEDEPDEDDDRDGDEREDEGEIVDAPRAILVPTYADRAARALTDLTANVADLVLGLVAGLAAGRPNAWGYVKRLTKAKGVFSARAGIHHRVLFAVRDRSLEVLDVIHRKDLETAVDRLL